MDLASSASGYSILVEKGPGLDVWSATKYPRKEDRVCQIAYHPARAKYLDYLIAHECGHIYRFFSAPPEKALVPAGDPARLQRAVEQLETERWERKDHIPKREMKRFLEALCSGLVRQLVNTPADCRIEEWIHGTFMELRDIQASALRELYSTCLNCLDRRVEQWTPPSIYQKSNALNYVMTKHVGGLLGKPDLIGPYVKAGYKDLGEILDSRLGKEDKGYIGDVQAADAWGRDLNVKEWYQWRRLE